MAAMNRMSMAQQLNEQIDGESILDGILGEVANSKSAFSGVGAEVAAASLAKSKIATDESRAKGLVAKKNASKAVEAAFTNPDASDARDIFAIMKADETNNKAELDADREARIIKARAVAPVDVDTSAARKSNNYKRAKDAIDENNSKVVSEQDQTYLDTGKLIEEAPLGNMNSTFVEDEFTGPDDMPYGDGPVSGGLMNRPPKARPLSVELAVPARGILDRIAVGEGNRPELLEKYQGELKIGTTPYDMVYNYGRTLAPSQPVSGMTLAELAKYQTDLIEATKGKVKVDGKEDPDKGTSAAGKYQVVRDSLFGKGGSAENPVKEPPSWAYKLKLKPGDIFDATLQERIGRLALRETGYDNWMKGEKDEAKMLKRISDIWASFEGSDAGQFEGEAPTKKADIEQFLKQVRPKGSK